MPFVEVIYLHSVKLFLKLLIHLFSHHLLHCICTLLYTFKRCFWFMKKILKIVFENLINLLLRRHYSAKLVLHFTNFILFTPLSSTIMKIFHFLSFNLSLYFTSFCSNKIANYTSSLFISEHNLESSWPCTWSNNLIFSSISFAFFFFFLLMATASFKSSIFY